MSLLMKALEKAAQDRKEGDPVPPLTSAAERSRAPPKSELMLEPAIAISRPSLPPAIASERDSAATIVRAGRRESNGIGTMLRDRPVWVVGAVGGLFAIGYGIYVYLQLSHPGFFVKTTSPPPITPLAAATVPALAHATPGSLNTAAPPFIPLQGDLPETNPSSSSTPAVAAASSESQGPTPTPEPAAAPEPRDTIKVTEDSGAPTLNPLSVNAYHAWETNDLDGAQRGYDELLKSDPNNLDALVGAAAIAARRGNSETAAAKYMRVLQLDPRNAIAQAALLSMFGNADPIAAETKLKQLIDQNPAPFLYFVLGNVYADQQRWADAQETYFQAQRLQPENPDYAYNLAVGLDHIGQSKLALEFYRRALTLAENKNHVNFSISAAGERISTLQKAAE